MSYWVRLEKDGDAVEVKPHTEGGTYAFGGLSKAELNVTYNYSAVYRLFDFSLQHLSGKTGGEATPRLEKLVDKLGAVGYEKDYWAPTPGNAGHALSVLLEWAKQHPDAVFVVA